MDITEFKKYMALLEPCLYYDEWADNIHSVLAYFDCPRESREPIRVMAEGWSYYSAGLWVREARRWRAADMGDG